MKIKEKCCNCESELILEEKEIFKLTKEEERKTQRIRELVKKRLAEKEIKGFIFKRKVMKYPYGSFEREIEKSNLITPYGTFKCPVCKTKQFIINKGD